MYPAKITHIGHHWTLIGHSFAKSLFPWPNKNSTFKACVLPYGCLSRTRSLLKGGVDALKRGEKPPTTGHLTRCSTIKHHKTYNFQGANSWDKFGDDFLHHWLPLGTSFANPMAPLALWLLGPTFHFEINTNTQSSGIVQKVLLTVVGVSENGGSVPNS